MESTGVAADEESIAELLGKNEHGASLSYLKKYNLRHEKGFIATDTENSATRQNLVEKLLESLLQLPSDSDLVIEILTALRHVSRDSTVVDKCLKSSATYSLILKHANFQTSSSKDNFVSPHQNEVQASKCLSNVVYLSKDSERLCSNSKFIKQIMDKISRHNLFTHDLNVTNLRLVFLVSALKPDGRKVIIEQCDGRTTVIDFLNDVLKKYSQDNLCEGNSFAVNDIIMCSEILKVVFNLNMDLRQSKLYSQQELHDLDRLLEHCRILLLSSCADDSSLTESLHCNTGNAIYSVPPQCLHVEKLLHQRKTTADATSSDGACAAVDMSAVVKLVDVLKRRVMNDDITTEILQPLLALLSQLCRSSRDIRRHLKEDILPPRRDFKNRPEEGLRFRNKLIKLFTHTNLSVKQGVADFLFVLCKENVDRFVKYTGYGNAAGLLASRGLLAGGVGDTVYSDTDSDSDTEEYKAIRDKINPVTGHVPSPCPNPMEGMTDEQKEYLAVQLANDISKLSSDSVIQPMTVGKDGNLIPLRQKVHETKLVEENSDSD